MTYVGILVAGGLRFLYASSRMKNRKLGSDVTSSVLGENELS